MEGGGQKTDRVSMLVSMCVRLLGCLLICFAMNMETHSVSPRPAFVGHNSLYGGANVEDSLV